MDSLPLIERLLLEWERRRNSGDPVTPEELCKDCLEHIDEVRSRIQALESMDFLLRSNAWTDSTKDSRAIDSRSSEIADPSVTTTITPGSSEDEILASRY